MRRLKIIFAPKWVFSHRYDETLPVGKLKSFLSEKDGMDCFRELVAELDIEYDDQTYSINAVKQIVLGYLCDTYGDEMVDVIKFVELKDGQMLDASDDEEQIEDFRDDDDYDDEDEDDLFERLFKSVPQSREESATAGKNNTSDKGVNTGAVKNVLNDTDALVGADEFKSLMKEIEQILPGMKRRGTVYSLLNQSYLFSVGDGMGMTTYAQKLLDLLKAHRIIKQTAKIREYKIIPPRDSRNAGDEFKDVENFVDNYCNSDEIEMIVIDISAYIGKVNSEEFRQFLRMLYSTKSLISVFRIPYVEKNILERVKRALSDILTVREVCIPPLCNEEIKQTAQKRFAQNAFSLTNSAWTYFMRRINEEKSDGRFYGFDTIYKVTRELVYIKERAISHGGKENYVIGANEAKALCSEKQSVARAFESLDALVGCEKIKEQINQVLAQIELAKKEGIDAPCMHMRFVGNPGTGKTTVARILGKIFKERGVLKIGDFFEYSGRDFCGIYIGETAPKTVGMCRDAYGSVMFIDEAYSLYRSNENSRDFGREAIDALIAEMENHKSELIVIMAGYTEDMDKLMEGNQGLKSRIPYTIEFPNFTREELYEIYCKMLNGRFAYEEALCSVARKYFDELPSEIYNAKEFGNGRFVRNLFERTWAKAALRCEMSKEKNVVLTVRDFESAIADKEFSFETKKKNKMGF